jgi:hypothetical protein
MYAVTNCNILTKKQKKMGKLIKACARLSTSAPPPPHLNWFSVLLQGLVGVTCGTLGHQGNLRILKAFRSYVGTLYTLSDFFADVFPGVPALPNV